MIYPRQKIHFTTPKGWCNDPNGLIYIEGTYHLFYQYYPDDTNWGPMHWGHAVSQNLLMWDHLPVALFPTQDEYCFSGSAILDTQNVSGLGKSKAPLLLFYTGHDLKTGRQHQCLAYSEDYVHFEKYKGNPVIKNPLPDESRALGGPDTFKKDFRDPKVVPNPAGAGWIMVLAAGHKIEFWHSDDLLNWNQTGDFTPGDYAIDGICECPDLLNFASQNKQVLTMSMIYWDETGTEFHAMQYFTGNFDGTTFTNVQATKSPLMLDYGNRNYAAVTFANTSPDEYIMMGWAQDWNEARTNNAELWFGKMTIARRLELVHGTLCQTPVCSVPLPTENENLWATRILLEVGQTFTKSGLTITMNSTHITVNDRQFPRSQTCATQPSQSRITIIYDHGLYELFADDGFSCFSGEISPLNKLKM